VGLAGGTVWGRRDQSVSAVRGSEQYAAHSGGVGDADVGAAGGVGAVRHGGLSG